MYRAIFLGGLTAALAAVAPTAAVRAQEALTKQQIIAAGGKRVVASTSALVGKTQYVVMLKAQPPLAKGDVFPFFYRDEQTRILKTRAGTKMESHWWIDNGYFCNEQRTVSVGNVCYENYQLKDYTYACVKDTDDCPAAYRLIPGNPENI